MKCIFCDGTGIVHGQYPCAMCDATGNMWNNPRVGYTLLIIMILIAAFLVI